METIFDLITREEIAYQTLPVPIVENYEWSMFKHITTTALYKNSQFITGKTDNKPFKNITLPILRLQYRAEGFDVKDIVLFVDDPDDYYKSFLVKKFHDKWARENKIDTFIDEMVESYVDYGGTLIKDVNDVKPEVVPWPSIAFCDQTDILSGPIALKHFYSPDQLKDMEAQGWGNPKNGATGTIDEVITLAENYKRTGELGGKLARTPGKYIQVYEVHGMFPDWWLDDISEDSNNEFNEDQKDVEYTRQLHIITFYIDKDDKKQYITLFRGPEKESPFKLILRDKIYGRALGLGGAEELFEPQVWVNYDLIRLKGLLDAAAKILYQTTDAAFANRNKTSELDNGEILVTETDTTITQINTSPVNLPAFEKSVADWEAHAQQLGAATDSIMGNDPVSGTPFKLQELVTQEANSLHEYRKGKIATFLDEIYEDWIIPYIAKEISKGQQFLSELSLDELQQVAESLVTCQTNDMIKEMILNGQEINPQAVQQYQQQVREQFMKGGNKRFIEILEGELKDAPLSVQVNIAGKEKDLSGYTDKLVNIFRQLIASPGVLDDPRMAKIFNEILESSGLSPVDFYAKPQPQQNNAPAPKVAETIAFNDLPPDGKVQMAAQAGIKIAPPAPNPPAPGPAVPFKQTITK